MRYLISKARKDTEERIYRIYISDSLYQQGQGKTLTERYVNLIKPKKVDNRSASEIASDVINTLGLEVI